MITDDFKQRLTPLSDPNNVHFELVTDDEDDAVAEEDQEDPGMTAAGVALLAAGDVMDGAMIALIPTIDDANRIVLPDGELISELHLTLWYLGKADAWSEDARDALLTEVVHDVSRYVGVVHAHAFGAALWNPAGDDPAIVLEVGDGPDVADVNPAYDARLLQVWGHVVDALTALGPDVDQLLPTQHSPWRPHVCLAYSTDPAMFTAALTKLGPITFDVLRIAFAGDHVDVPLNDGATIGGDGST